MKTQTDHLPELIHGLLEPSAYPAAPETVTLIQTHVSYIFLAGDRVFKVKKALNLGFLDFTTLEQREHACRREVELNRRLCPQLYLGVRPIVLAAGRPHIGGAGQPVEWAVEMWRLPHARLLTTLLGQDEVTTDDIERIALRLAAFHARAERSAAIDAFGSIETIRGNVVENFAQLTPFRGQTIEAAHHRRLEQAALTFLDERAALFAERVSGGHIRDCHGDVHAGSICLTDEVLIFDCIEFNDRFRYGDTAAEIAFLAMDLDHFGRADLAWSLVDAYARAARDRTVAGVVDFYKGYRALVRAKVESLRAAQAEVPAAERTAAAGAARDYGDLALAYAGDLARPALFITVGLMGTGKSTLARALTHRLPLVYRSTDIVRKQLAGVAPTEHRYAAYGQGLYTSELSERTYTALLDEAAMWLKRGVGVILDASFIRRRDRDQARALAGALGVPFLAIECTCAEALIRQRLEARLSDPQAVSDGHWGLYERQRAAAEPCTELPPDSYLRVDTGQPLEQAGDRVRDHLVALAGEWLRATIVPAQRRGEPPESRLVTDR